ncbi:MAG: hypothetical protein VB064_08310 [Oscillospiraceae bacterium]|nr:hypothetical protein [Oscillospiraceae bacterium]
MEKLKDMKDIYICLVIVYPLVNKYGNATDTTVITAAFPVQ